MDLTEDPRPFLRLLGTLSLQAGGEEVLAGRRKPLLFLAFVACHGARGVSRAAVVDMFWGDGSEARARQSVRQALLLLRGELGDALEADRDRIRIRPERLRVDVLELRATLEEHLVDAADPADATGGVRPSAGPAPRPATAVGVAASDALLLLPGADTDASPDFLHWLDAERASLGLRIRSWCREQLEEAASSRDHARRAQVARLWCEAAPLDTAPMETLLDVLPLLGRAEEALERWTRWSARYASVREGSPPESMARTVLNLQMSLAGRGSGVEGAAPGAPLPRESGEDAAERSSRGPGSLALFSSDLMERQVIQARLHAALNGARQGEGRILALTGPEGMGKSRLLREFLRELMPVGDNGVLVLSTEPLPPDEESPLGAARALLRSLPGAPGLGGASEEALAQVAELVPEVRRRFPGLPRAETPTPTLRGQALASVLEVVAEEIPVVIAVDDLPDLDTESRQVLAELLRSPLRGILVVVATEEDPTRTSSGLLNATDRLERIELPPLSVEGVMGLLRSMMTLDPALAESLAPRLQAAATGNPLLLVVMVQALADAGELAPGPDGVWRLRGGTSEAPLPPLEGLRTTLAPRWNVLPPSLRKVLEALAVLGGPAPATRLSQMAGVAPDLFDAALDGLLARRLVREIRTPEGPTHLDFPHEFFRRAAYDAINPRRREELHGQAAAALLREAQLRPRLRPLVADHLARSGHSAESESGGPPGSEPATGARTATGAGPGNETRTGTRRRLATTFAVAALLLLAWWGLAGEPADDDLVAIFPFETTTNPDLAWMGVGVADLLAGELDDVGGIRTVDRHALSAVLPGGEISPSDARRIARRLGAGSWVLGRVLEIEDEVTLQASLYRGRGRVARINAEPTPASTVVGEVDRLARFLLPSLLAADSMPRLDLATRTTRSIPALRSFVEGEAAFRAGRYAAAIEAYEAATSLDPEFALAHLRTALALEWGGNATASGISTALAAADASRSRLPAKERQLLGSMIAYHGGRHLEAVESLRALLAEEPDFVDGWFALAEVLFHTLPRTGNPDALAEAHRVLLEVLTLSPDHREALLHLPRTALHLGDVEAAEEAMRRLRQTELAERPIFLPSEVFVAWARDDRDAMARLLPLLESAPPLLVLVSGAFLSVYAQRADLAAELTSTLDHPLRTGDARGAGRLWTSVFLRRAGDVEGSDEALREAARWLPREALRLEALYLLNPDPASEPGPPVNAARRADVLARIRSEAGSGAANDAVYPAVPGDPTDGLPLPWPAAPSWTPGAATALDAYLAGLLLAADGEVVEAARYLGILDAMQRPPADRSEAGPTSEETELVAALRQGLAADLLRRDGRPSEALQLLRDLRLGGWHQAAFSSPYFALPRERRLMGHLLRETGAADEAERWMRSLASATPFDGIWPAPN